MQRLHCVFVCISMLVCSWKITERKENDKLEGEKKKKDSSQVNKNQKKFYTHSSAEDSTTSRHRFLFFSLWKVNQRPPSAHLVLVYNR